MTRTQLHVVLDGNTVFDLHRGNHPLEQWGIALIGEEGRTAFTSVMVRPVA